MPGGGFLVVERDDDAAPADPAAQITKKVYAFNLTGATDITAKDVLYARQVAGPDEHQPSWPPWASRRWPRCCTWTWPRAGYDTVQKVEGLAYIDANTLAVINDNDFGVAGISIDNATGTFRAVARLPRRSRRCWAWSPPPVWTRPTATMWSTSATGRCTACTSRTPIASFTAGRRTYLITANEGDARDYAGFAEEVRARSVRSSYPAAIQPVLNDNLQLGRLTVTSAPPGGD